MGVGADSTLTAPEDPTNDGHRFDGWYTDADCTTAYDFSSIVTADTTLYAKWVAVYTVSFETSGGATRADQVLDTGATATKPVDPTRYEYDFKGWYADEDCTVAFDFSTPITADTTIYAKWEVEVPEVASADQYTYNTYMSTFPTVWNNHTYQTATDSEIIGYTELGFYTFDYNDTMDGFKVVPEMATDMPVDVTADYVGEEWGIGEGEAARAWKITLRSDLKWEDGQPITAHDFVTSAQLLLNPVANNYRADSLYEGELVLVNAKDYFYAGKSVTEDNGSTGAYLVADLVKGADGVYTTPEGNQIWIALGSPLSWLGGNSLAAYVNAYGSVYFDMDAWAAIVALADASGNVPVTDESIAHLVSIITYSPDWGETADDAYNYLCYESTYPELSFDKVGIKALSDTELVLILEAPLEGFYLHYNLTGSWLVREDLYNACVSYDPATGIYNNTYGTSVDTYMSYGPYKLTTFQRDKRIVLTKNNEWYGHGEGVYQTTRIVYDWIDNPETAMQAFLQGKLDEKGLDVDQMAVYGESKHLYYTDGASTFFIAMNPDEEAFSKWEADHDGKDKSIMTIKEFRMALSFALDRQAFNLACDPTGSSAFAVFNNLIISDPENGTPYRTTEQAKDVILEFWGISQDDIGPGKLYADKDAAIASITGYNLDYAKKLFDQAYDNVIAAGLMDTTDVVEICIGLPSAQAKFYVNGYNFLVDCYTEAVKGTKLEGKLTFTKDDTIGNGFSDALEANQVNLLFGVGWSGSALNPYNLMMAYTTPRYQYDVNAWDTSVEEMLFAVDSLDGKLYTATVEAWTYMMMGQAGNIYEVELDENGNAKVDEDGKYVRVADGAVEYSCGLNDNRPEERLDLFAALEGAVLRTYDLLPLNNQSSAALKGMQIKYYTEEYVYGVGRGGIKYMTYNYNDAEWAAFVQSQGGTLNYK